MWCKIYTKSLKHFQNLVYDVNQMQDLNFKCIKMTFLLGYQT